MNKYDLSKETENALYVIGTAIGTAIAGLVIKWINNKFSDKN